MNTFVDSFLVSEVFISSVVIFTLYYLFFSQKNKLKKSKKTIVVFSVILFIFLQHIMFEIVKYFFNLNDIVFFRLIANVLFIPLMLFLFFYVRENVDYKLWLLVVSSYILAVIFVGMGWFLDYSLIVFLQTFFKITTSVLFYILVFEFLVKK